VRTRLGVFARSPIALRTSATSPLRVSSSTWLDGQSSRCNSCRETAFGRLWRRNSRSRYALGDRCSTTRSRVSSRFSVSKVQFPKRTGTVPFFSQRIRHNSPTTPVGGTTRKGGVSEVWSLQSAHGARRSGSSGRQIDQHDVGVLSISVEED